jgi:hypothetical protein
LVLAVLSLEIRIQTLLFWLVVIFTVKKVFLDYRIVKVNRKRFYWVEHGPLVLLIFLAGLFDIIGIGFFEATLVLLRLCWLE